MSRKRDIITLRWHCKAFSTNLHEGPDRYQGDPHNAESIWLCSLDIASVVDRDYPRDHPALGKYLLEFTLTVYGNDGRVGVDNRVTERLQKLQDAGVIAGFHVDCSYLVYFNPVKGEQFTQTALVVASKLMKNLGVPQYCWQKFDVFRESQFWPKDAKWWLDFATHLKRQNKDLLGKLQK